MPSAASTSSARTTGSSSDRFSERFFARERAVRYRDRFRTGRHARIDRLERATLTDLLAGLPRMPIAMDVPCGVGRLSGVLHTAAERVIMADASPIMLELAREAHEPHAGDQAVEFVETRCETLSRPDASVDLIFCHRFLHHLDLRAERALVLREFARVAAKYVILNHYPSGLRTRSRRIVARLMGRTGDERIASAEQLAEEAADAGLRLLRTFPVRRFPVGGSFLLFEPVSAGHSPIA